jgi:integrase/recombinase XerD
MDEVKKISITNVPISFDTAQTAKKEAVWQRLAEISVAQAIKEWLDSLQPLTAKNYLSGMNILVHAGLLKPGSSLQEFSLLNHDSIIDRIKQIPGLSECSKQARAACYIAFTRFLNRRTQGVIVKAIPSREGTDKTFYRVREKVHTQAMNRAEWSKFLEELKKINARDCLIAKIILQGGKRVNEALSLTTKMIDPDKCEITFKQSKTKGYERETVITYTPAIIKELLDYIGDRDGIVFVTKSIKKLTLNQLSKTFNKAGKNAGLSFKITPHVLRASTVTYLKTEGFSDSDIMKVTGHASSQMVNAYDRSERALNASKKVSLV